MKATVLVDNISNCNLLGEWGLSIYIEHKGNNILLDTGASELFLSNSKELNVDISKVDYGVLSHAHYDHSNGLAEFFKANQKANFYIQKSCGENCYERHLLKRPEYIGITKGTLDTFSDRITRVEGKYKLCDGAWLLSHTTLGLEKIGKYNHMYVRENKKWKLDGFKHEQSVIIQVENGIVVFNSCSHGGAPNILKEVKEAFPDDEVIGLIGGFHLYNRDDAYVINFAQQLNQSGITRIYTGHCTGGKQYELLKSVLGDKVEQINVGLVMNF